MLEKQLATDKRQLAALRAQPNTASRKLGFSLGSAAEAKAAALQAYVRRIAKITATLSAIMARSHATSMSIVQNLK